MSYRRASESRIVCRGTIPCGMCSDCWIISEVFLHFHQWTFVSSAKTLSSTVLPLTRPTDKLLFQVLNDISMGFNKVLCAVRWTLDLPYHFLISSKSHR